MKTFLRLFLGWCLATVLVAQETPPDDGPRRSQADLDKLVAPIALYPDALVALILPAATSTADIVLAARFLDADGKEADIDQQAWDDSVKSLARYPDLIRWMDENLEWTRELGAAFLAQPADVMNTVQALREKARAAGLLKDTPEQRVVVREEKILILPARSHYVHIPTYDPEILYVQEYYNPRPFLTFSVGFAVGSWLSYDCDWHRHTVWKHRRPPGWVYHPDWRWHYAGRRPLDCDEWRPHPHTWRRHRERHAHYHARPVPHVRHPRFDRHGDRRDGFGPHDLGRRDRSRRPDDGRSRLGPREPNPDRLGGPAGERRHVRGTSRPGGSLAPAGDAPVVAPAPEAGAQRYLDKRLQQRHRDRLERPMPAAGPDRGLTRAAPAIERGSRAAPGVTRSEPAIRSAVRNREGRDGGGRFDRAPRAGGSAPAAAVAPRVEARPEPRQLPPARVEAPPPRVESAPVRESQPAIRANQIRENRGGGGGDRGNRFSRGSREN